MNLLRLGLIAALLFTISCDSRSGSITPARAVENEHAAPAGQANTGQETARPIELTEITWIQSKGRVQDGNYNRIPVVDKLIAQGPSCIPFLIDRLNDETSMKSEVIDLWNRVTVADVVLIILTDLFTDSSWEKSTVPGASWNSIIEYPEGSGKSAEQALREFVRKNGRGAIKAKWMKIWNDNHEKIFWDERERCFKIEK